MINTLTETKIRNLQPRHRDDGHHHLLQMYVRIRSTIECCREVNLSCESNDLRRGGVEAACSERVGLAIQLAVPRGKVQNMDPLCLLPLKLLK